MLGASNAAAASGTRLTSRGVSSLEGSGLRRVFVVGESPPEFLESIGDVVGALREAVGGVHEFLHGRAKFLIDFFEGACLVVDRSAPLLRHLSRSYRGPQRVRL